MAKKMMVQNIAINYIVKNKSDYISLTDIAKSKNNQRTNYIIQNWMRTKDTVEFLGLWEIINNPNFKGIEFDAFKKSAGLNSFSLTPKKWIADTKAIGLISAPGRYGGTFAHKDIAFEFASWISAEFKLFLIKEFQRLKEIEAEQLKSNWSAKRALTKINYRLHTEAIKEHLIPALLSTAQINLTYASEADILNLALFGQTAANWRQKYPKKEGNLRDYTNIAQLICLANLETLNAEFISQGLSQKERMQKLNQIAIKQMKFLIENQSVERLEKSDRRKKI